MDALPYVDSLIREYLLFRGFVSSLEAFGRDLDADPGCGLQADRIADLIFRKLLPGLDCSALVGLLDHLNGLLYSRLDSRYEPLVAAVEADLLRAFLVTAAAAGRPDKVADFFKLYGPQLLSSSSNSSSSAGWTGGGEDGSGAPDWRDWFVLSYLQHPEREPRFQVYFSPEWLSLLEASFRNFLAGVMRCLPLPAVLRFNTDRRLRLALQQQVSALQSELSRAKQQLAEATEALQQQNTQQQANLQQDQLPAAQQRHVQQHPQSAEQQEAQQTQQQQPQQAPVLRASLDGVDARHEAAAAPHHPAAAASGATVAAAHPHASASGRASVRHSRDPSLDDWQQQHLQLRHSRRSSTASDGDGQELQQMHHQPAELQSMRSSTGSSSSRLQPGGSGLFELLPSGSPAPPSTAAAAGATAQGAGGAAVSPVVRLARQQQQGHGRSASSGGISFDPALAAAAGQASAGTADDDEQQEQGSSSRRASSESSPAPITIPVGSSAAATSVRASDSAAASSPSGAATAAAVLSSSPVMSWSAGMLAASSASGMRPRHTAATAGGSSGSTALAASSAAARSLHGPGSAAGFAPAVLLPGPLRWRVDVQPVQHQQAAAAAAQPGVSCVAFSPSGANVASACADGLVAIWSPPGLISNAGRHAAVACGVPVACLAWDGRADKLMLIGCSGGGGVRAWHADTRRIMADVPAEPGFPNVAALAACPSEPAFAVAANTAQLDVFCSYSSSDSSSPAAAAAARVSGRLAVYNGRSFKRSAVLALPDEVGLASLAYSSSGSQLVVGTAAGSALLYEPSSRSSPLRVWQVAAALPAAAGADAPLLVQVAWRAASSAGSGLASSAAGPMSGSSSVGAGSFLTLCCGVLCEWRLTSVSSKIPLLAIDVIAAAAAALEQEPAAPADGASQDTPSTGTAAGTLQQVQPTAGCSHSTANSSGRLSWVCRYAVSPDGSRVAVVAGQASAGVLLLYDLPATGNSSSSSSSSSRSGSDALAQPQVLLQGGDLAAGCCVSWHPREPVLVVGCGSSSRSLTISLTAAT